MILAIISGMMNWLANLMWSTLLEVIHLIRIIGFLVTDSSFTKRAGNNRDESAHFILTIFIIFSSAGATQNSIRVAQVCSFFYVVS